MSNVQGYFSRRCVVHTRDDTHEKVRVANFVPLLESDDPRNWPEVLSSQKRRSTQQKGNQRLPPVSKHLSVLSISVLLRRVNDPSTRTS